MRCIKLLLLFLCGLVMSARVLAQSKTLLERPIAEAPGFAKMALVIGVGDYEHASKLSPHTHVDARAFAQLLRTRFDFPEAAITVMTDEEDTPAPLRPTYAHLLSALNSLVNRVTEKTEVIIYFSGHGIRVGDHDYLVPLDGDPADVKGLCIDYAEFHNRLETRNPARALIIVDACRNLEGGKSDVGSGFGAGPQFKGPQFAELFSCQPKQVSQLGIIGKPGGFTGSVFTHFLLEGLSGEKQAQENGLVTFESLKDYLQGSVSQYVSQNYGGLVQVPVGRSLGRMVLAKGGAPSPMPPPNPIPPRNRAAALLAAHVPEFIQQAQAMAEGIGDIYDRSFALNSIAAAQAENGDTTGATITLNKALLTARGIDEAIRKNAALSYIAATQAQSGDVIAAKQTADEIPEAGRSVALSSIAAAQAQSGDVGGAKITLQQAIQIFNKTIPMAEGSIASFRKAVPLSSIAVAQAESGDATGATITVNKALQTIDGIDEIHESIRKTLVLCNIATTQAKSGNAAEAKSTLNEAKSLLRKAPQTAEPKTGVFRKSYVLSNIVTVQAQIGDVAGARLTAKEIPETSDLILALSSIAVAQAKCGDAAGATQTLQAAIQAVEGVTIASDKVWALSSIAQAISKVASKK